MGALDAGLGPRPPQVSPGLSGPAPVWLRCLGRVTVASAPPHWCGGRVGETVLVVGAGTKLRALMSAFVESSTRRRPPASDLNGQHVRAGLARSEIGPSDGLATET